MRFIINLPQEELESVERICFQVEEAQWYYEDFVRPLDPELPSLNLRNFCLRIFQHCPLLSEFSPYHHATAFEEFLAYKTRVPVRGAVMLNEDMDEVVLVKGWKKGANWSFPRGKINKDESDLACAMREVYEETGYDVEAAGLARDPEATKYIDVAIQHQHIRLYVFRGVPMDALFEARTRKEISKIEWWRLSDLPTLKKKKQQQEGRGEDLALNANKFYMVAPFLVPLKKWISQQKKMGRSKKTDQVQPVMDSEFDERLTEENGIIENQHVPASEDMERLLAGLRQPARGPISSDARTPNTMASVEDASTQLKNLLRVPSAAQTAPIEPVKSTIVSAEAERASTLLALLRGGPSVPKAPAPKTPMEQLAEPPSMPESPKPHRTVPLRVSTLSPPPAFPLSPDNVRRSGQALVTQPIAETMAPRVVDTDKASIAAWKSFEATSGEQEAAKRKALMEERAARLAEEERTGIKHEPTLPAMNETWRQVKVGGDTNMRQAGGRQISNVVQRSTGGRPQYQQTLNEQSTREQETLHAAAQPVPAPYQATSNAHVAANSRYTDIYRPAIPAADKLPMPKLTAHSSSLLDLFKGGHPSKAVVDASRSSGPAMKPPLEPQDAAAEHVRSQAPQGRAVNGVSALKTGPPKAPSSKGQGTSDTKRSQSTHQATLLDLFRKPSISAAEATLAPKPALDVPTDLVELSALPSPGHSREASKTEVNELPKALDSTTSRPLSVQKDPLTNTKHGRPPVSATVNGPLNVPQFHMIASKPKTSGRKTAVNNEVKKSPVTILARPSTARTGASPDTSTSDGHAVNGPVIPPPPGLDADTDRPPTPKQILRRPAPTESATDQRESPKFPPIQQSPKIPPIHQQPPPPTRGTPSPLSASDRPSSLKPDHKSALLSLFTNTPPSPNRRRSSGGGPDLSAFISPVTSTKPPSSFFPAPLLPPKNAGSTLNSAAKSSRMSSLANSITGVDTAGPHKERVGAKDTANAIVPPVRQKPKKTTSDVDRDFLRGYLEGVARKEGK